MSREEILSLFSREPLALAVFVVLSFVTIGLHR